MLSANEIVHLQDRQTVAWHQLTCATLESAPGSDGLPSATEDIWRDVSLDPLAADCRETWLTALTRQHRANFELWHIEDEARRLGAADAELASVKRRVDRTNQRRNDLAEALDRFLLGWLEARDLPAPLAPLNSESPGLIIDRLSILSLKIYHTREEAKRPDAPEGHAERNRGRLAILEEQRGDLSVCLEALWQQTLAGTRRFKLYRQLKMYNDPSLNPAIYASHPGKTVA
jgi:hypothetical protein